MLEMIDDDYTVYKRYNDFALAKQIANILRVQGVRILLIDNSPPVDITFSINTSQNELELKIHKDDFIAARNVLEAEMKKEAESVDANHYLFKFTNEELYEILYKSDEWSEFDFVLAQNILKQRGESINKATLNTFQAKRIEELSKTENGQLIWIVLGYISAIGGGFLGMVIGWFLWSLKKTLPNGEKIFVHNSTDRKHGRMIFFIGLVVFPLFFGYRLWLAR